AQRLLVAVEGDVRAQRLGVEARVPQCSLGDAWQILGEQARGLPAPDPPPGRRELDGETCLDGVGRDRDAGALEDLLPRRADADALPRRGRDLAGQEVRGRDVSGM